MSERGPSCRSDRIDRKLRRDPFRAVIRPQASRSEFSVYKYDYIVSYFPLIGNPYFLPPVLPRSGTDPRRAVAQRGSSHPNGSIRYSSSNLA